MIETDFERSPREVGIIVVSYNTREITLDAIRSVEQQTDPTLYDLVVVDNASADGSADAIAKEFPHIRLLRLDENIGFARANNLAASLLHTPYLLLLNPDTIVLNDAIGNLYQFALRTPDARMWGGRTLYPDRTLNPLSCWNRMTPWSVFCQLIGLKALLPRSEIFNSEAIGNWRRDSVKEVDIIAGCFLMIDKALWEQLEGFDTDFFMYGEDADLCLRAKSVGAKPTICPAAELVHYGGASENVRVGKMTRLLSAKTTLMHRHWSALMRALGHLFFWAFPLPRIIGYGLAAIIRQRPSDKEDFAAWVDIWRARKQWLRGYLTSERAAG